MLPNNALSSVSLPGAFLAPDDKRPRITRKLGDTTSYGQCLDASPQDWEMGGIGLNDPTQGLLVQTWKFWLDGDDVKVGPDPDGPWTTLFSGAGITEISGSFDVNMAPAVAYTQAEETKLWWYNPLIPGYTVTTFVGTASPRLALDDKRTSQSGNADIIFAYLRAGGLYYRQWRDRYATERFLCNQPPNTLRLGRIGMGSTNRMQFEFLTGG